MGAFLEKHQIPNHVAIIMDGNGRWASRRGLGRIEGHKRGKDAVKSIVEASRDLGLSYLTLYAFSTQNWYRPREEVKALMALLNRYLRTELRRMMNYNIRLRVIGDLERLPRNVRKSLISLGKHRAKCKTAEKACISLVKPYVKHLFPVWTPKAPQKSV